MKRRFKFSNAFNFFHQVWVSIVLVKKKKQKFGNKISWFGWFVLFLPFCPAFSCEKREKMALFPWWHVRKRIDHWFSVTTGKCQPSGPPLQWETRQASIPTGTLDPRVRSFLSSLNINDRLYLSQRAEEIKTFVIYSEMTKIKQPLQ